MFRPLGAAIGVPLVGLVIQQVVGAELQAYLEPDEARDITRKLGDGIGFIKHLRPKAQEIVRHCYRDGIMSGFFLCTAFLFVAALSTIWWREKRKTVK